LAVRTSHPDWMVERWIARYGPGRTRAICEAHNRYDGTVLRVIGRLKEANIDAVSLVAQPELKRE
ncbi:MAG: hypothetical protein ACE5HF_04075, partial [Gemmatimonadota bacterium]